jgi:hypothetical protein
VIRGLILLALLLLAASPGAARENRQEEKLREIAARGRLLFEVDRAGWVATDDLMERAPEAKGWPVKGWIVERDGDSPHSYVVTFFGDGESGPAAWYVGKVRDNKVTSGELFPADRRPALSPAQQKLVQARAAALAEAEKARFQPCTPSRFNVAVLPPSTEGGAVDVYLLSAQTESTVYPFGGHYKVSVGADGRAKSKRKFTNSCLNMSSAGLPDGAELAAPMVTHLLDPLPTEIHVFMSLTMGKPVGVGTRGGMWWVEGERIESLAGR